MGGRHSRFVQQGEFCDVGGSVETLGEGLGLLSDLVLAGDVCFILPDGFYL